MDSPRSFGIIVPAGVMWCECQRNQEEPEMNATTVAVDLAKNVFQLAYADPSWKVITTSRLSRSQFQRCFHNSSVSLVIMEACGTAHYWARQLQTLGIEVRLLPPRYIRAYVKRNKTDAADAAALLEAARCADIQPVRIKSVDQQALQCLHRTRSLWMSTPALHGSMPCADSVESSASISRQALGSAWSRSLALWRTRTHRSRHCCARRCVRSSMKFAC